jgi:hypothetical protein
MLDNYKNKQLDKYKTMDEKKQPVKEKKVSFYDPVANAYREIPVSLAKKYLANVEKLKKQIN